MRNNLEMKKQSGFTLIEIAIVMVIIGLLIGGVLKGQALIDNAKIKSVVKDMQGVQAAWYGYYDRKHEYATLQTDYITADGATDFWFDTRTEGLMVGNPTTPTPGVNAMGGSLGVVSSLASTGLAGTAVCTSVLAKFAQGIDAGLDDGLSTSGSVRGTASSAQNQGVINEGLVGASPIATEYGTGGYINLCMEL